MEPTNFNLQFRRTPTGLLAEASVENRKAKHESPLPFEGGAWEDLVSLPFRDARPSNKKRLWEEVADVGRRLFEASFAGDIGILWQTSLLEASRSGQRVRLCLHFWDEEGLSDWPWEWLYDPRRRSFLSVSVETPLVRYPAAMDAARPLKCSLPLRILVVAASPPGLGRIDVQREWKALQDSLHGLSGDQVQIELLPKATLPDLQSELREGFHVLHFIGHGFFNRDQRQGGLLFEDGNGGIKRVTGPELANLFQGREDLSLIVLNACEGARTDALSPSPGVAQSLAFAGIPAVVAMQFKISDPSAIIFAGHFYRALAEGDPLDVAVAEARQGMFCYDREVIEWGTPVLFLRSKDGRLFDIRNGFWAGLWRLLKRNWGFLVLLGVCAAALDLGLRTPDSPLPPTEEEARSDSTSPSPSDDPVPPPNTNGCPPSEILGLEFVRIEPAMFVMGSKRRLDGKKRIYEVEITRPYCMSVTEVTQEQWEKVMHYNPSAHKGDGQLPVENVSYNDVERFVEELNRLEPGVEYNLPTEAQWQYGAQAGTGQPYSFGEDDDELPRYGNCLGKDKHDGTAPVKKFVPNQWGIYDMHGNVSEWVKDWYGEYPWGRSSDPKGPQTGERRVRRGGSWKILAKNCTTTKRNQAEPGYHSDDVGFRLVRTPEN